LPTSLPTPPGGVALPPGRARPASAHPCCEGDETIYVPRMQPHCPGCKAPWPRLPRARGAIGYQVAPHECHHCGAEWLIVYQLVTPAPLFHLRLHLVDVVQLEGWEPEAVRRSLARVRAFNEH